MRKAMAGAEVGDDVLGDDPTINRLQERIAAMLKKDDALFMPSGTMANEVAVCAHTRPGDEVILEESSHIIRYEAGGPAFLSGVQLRPLKGSRGALSASQIETAINADNVHFPVTRLVCLENTHNSAGGTIFPLPEMESVRRLANRTGLKMHLDGARLWNASVASGIPLESYGRLFDSVSLCFSKGLGAPVGSILAGDADFIRTARRRRKIFGGGMRQAGILAAAAEFALDNHIGRLAQDHRNARRLAEAVSGMPGIVIDLDSVQTNIVYMEIKGAKYNVSELVSGLHDLGVAVLASGPARIRAVTHLDISEDDIEQAIHAFSSVLSSF